MLLIFCLSSSSTFSQTYGEIFTNTEANQKFGRVLISVALPTSSLQGLLNRTNNFIMFKIIDGEVFVLDKNRNVLYPEGKTFNSQEVFTMFSISVMNELLNLGNKDIVLVEQRSSVLSVSNGGFTLEVGVFCPTFCPDDD
jgi:hypothetical protein